jgi:hypothetical protein
MVFSFRVEAIDYRKVGVPRRAHFARAVWSPWPRRGSILSGLAPHAVDIGLAIGRQLAALGAPEHFAEAFEHVVQRFVAVAAPALQQREGGADAGRLVDRQLLLDRQVQREMQEGIGLALLRRPFARQRVFGFEQGVVFGMQFDQVGGQGSIGVPGSRCGAWPRRRSGTGGPGRGSG